jgi:DMSO/TMAO reductase YedYZ molybdopterin-dependent catalytic subunit
MKARIGFASFCLALLMAVFTVAAPSALRSASALQASPEASPAAGADTVELTGLVETPGQLTVADLQTLTAETVDVTFQAAGNEQKHTYTGVRLWDVLDRAKLKLNPDNKNDQLRKYVVLSAKDGYEVVISLGEIDPGFGHQPYLLAWDEDGAPLTGEDGPVRLVTPGDIKGGRYVYGVIKIEVRDIDSPPRA